MGRLRMDFNHLKGKKCVCSSSGSVASATSSSSRSSNGTINGKYGVRTVHLKRQCGIYLETNGKSKDNLFANVRPNNFGFSFRGGKEFGTGFFISAVENDSDAYYKGLKVGDQIMRINGLSVEDATHQEVLQLAQSHHQITLTVKSVGIIPVKDKSEDPLTWKLVDHPVDDQVLPHSGDIDRILIEIPENSQLGCGICKGPDWRPGIFIQYTKPNSLARRCGLQPGDQILQCNRISFLQIDFTYAVSVLKNVRTLDLVLKKGSGIDLFPGESSGYSSSSSIADEAIPPPPALSKRLSIVAEESDEKYQRKQCHCKTGKNTLKASASIDSIFESFPSDERSNYRERSKSIEILTDSNFKKTVTFKNNENVSRTILNITNGKPRDNCRCVVGSQTIIKIENNDVQEVKSSSMMSGKEEATENGRISVEVHRSDEKYEKCSSDKVPIEKSPSSSSFSSGCSLSSAISQEIQRRNERRLKGAGIRPERAELLKPSDKQQRHQHDMLIAELKKKQGWEDKTTTVSTQTEKNSTDPRLPPTRTRQRTAESVPVSTQIKINPEQRALLTTFKPLPKNPEDSPPACPTPDYYSDNSLTDQSIETSHTVKNSILKFEEKNKSCQISKTVTFGQNSTKEITPIKNLVRSNKILMEKKNSDVVEMQSIESYELTEPKLVPPKPPPTYFQPPNRSDLEEPKRRTTVIKITEYPTEKKREPVKFDFLNRNENDKVFENELASTLSRSNLRNKTDAFAKSDAVKINGETKNPPAQRYSSYNGLHPTPVIPTEVTENQICNVKKTLKTFERNTSNTVILKIPKRN